MHSAFHRPDSDQQRVSLATRIAAAIALLCVPALPLGCGGGGSDGARPSVSPATDEAPPAFDLAGELPYADQWCELSELDPNLYENRRFLSKGWQMPGASSSEEVEDGDLLWARRREAVVRLYVAEPAPRRLGFRIHPLVLEGQDSGTLSVLWNDTPVFEGELASEAYSIEVPASVQTTGLNELRLRFPRAQRPVRVQEDSNELRQLSAAVGRIAIEIEDDAVARRARDAHELQPAGVRWADTSMGERQTIEQTSSSGLRFALTVPPAATFEAEVLYARHAGEGPEKARFQVFVTPDGGERRLLCEAVTKLEKAVPLSASLAELAGRGCRFDFVVRPEGSPEPVVGWWHRPRLVSADAAEEPAAQSLPAAVRERLAHAPVILFLFDATNASFLSCYGGRPGLTPNFDRLAREGVLFRRAQAQASYTVASVASTLTSRFAWEHGTWMENTSIRSAFPTWPEHFRDAGYQTQAVFCSPNGSGIFGNDRGFEHHADLYKDLSPAIAKADDVLPVLDEVLARRDASRPPFLWFHIIEPHEPYGPPEPWAGSLTDGDYAGRVEGDAHGLWSIRRWTIDPTDEELAHIQRQYEENLAYADDAFGRIRERLEQAGLWDRAVVAFFSDHGEGFLEHSGIAMAGMGHGSTVYDEMTHIPFVFRLPEGLAPEGVERDSLAANIDLLPTVADLVGVPPIPGSQGVSLARELLDPQAAPTRDYVIAHSASMHGERFLPIFAMWEGHWKLVYRSGEGTELYDLEADPGERHNLAAEHPVRADVMRQDLRRRARIDLDLGWAFTGGGGEIDDAVRQQLEALGYGK